MEAVSWAYSIYANEVEKVAARKGQLRVKLAKMSLRYKGIENEGGKVSRRAVGSGVGEGRKLERRKMMMSIWKMKT